MEAVPVLEPGFVVGIALDGDVGDALGFYVGEIQTLDDTGIRVTLVDWLIGSFTEYDLYVRWDRIHHMVVSTPSHTLDLDAFGHEQTKWDHRFTVESADLPA